MKIVIKNGQKFFEQAVKKSIKNMMPVQRAFGPLYADPAGTQCNCTCSVVYPLGGRPGEGEMGSSLGSSCPSATQISAGVLSGPYTVTVVSSSEGWIKTLYDSPGTKKFTLDITNLFGSTSLYIYSDLSGSCSLSLLNSLTGISSTGTYCISGSLLASGFVVLKIVTTDMLTFKVTANSGSC
jgi:hypothetical protein